MEHNQNTTILFQLHDMMNKRHNDALYDLMLREEDIENANTLNLKKL